MCVVTARYTLGFLLTKSVVTVSNETKISKHIFCITFYRKKHVIQFHCAVDLLLW